MLANLVGKSKRRLKLLVVSPEIPRPDQSGGDLRLFALLRLLAGRHRVDLYSLAGTGDKEGSSPHEATLREAGIRVLPGAWLFGLEQALFGRIYDAIVFEFWWTADRGAGLVSRHQPWAKILVDSVDLHYRRDQAGLSLGISELDPATVEADKQRELATYRRAHAVVCVSDEDGRVLDAEGGIARRFTIPLVVPGRTRTAGRRDPELLFLGGFRHAPNRDGLLWFIRAIWPAIRLAVPGARLTVIGSHHMDLVSALSEVESVDLIGYVLDVASYFDRAALMVAPLRFGAGMKTKVVEAMAAGLPVVTTRVGTQGLDVASGEHLMIADEPEEFARRVVALLDDPERAELIGQSGRRYVATLCSAEAIDSHLEAMLASVIDGRRPIIPPRDWWFNSARTYARRIRASLGRMRRSIVPSGWPALPKS